jgi:F0F1-type ATP synthase assembly protein I
MKDDEHGQLASIASWGVEFVSAIAVGVLIGLWIDKHFDKSPIFLILFFFLGCVSGYFNILRRLARQKDK